MLKVKNLSKNFGGIKVVKNCSFELCEISINALIGLNGSGKSTLLNLISGLIKSDSGEITLSQKVINNLSVEEFSKAGISTLLQDIHLFENLSVKQNLQLAFNDQGVSFWRGLLGKDRLSKKRSNEIKKTLELIGMLDLEDQKTANLSYGQKRLVQIARAFLNPHKLLILDEPLAGLNEKLKRKISNLLLYIKGQGTTILIVDHDINFLLNLADNIIVLDTGEVVAFEKNEKIQENKKSLNAYLVNKKNV